MNQNICEYLRQRAVEELFAMSTFENCWVSWKAEIERRIPSINGTNVINLGDNLSEIFRLTSTSGRSQSSVSGAGSAWEALVCWYLNLSLIGTRTVVIKQKKSLLPDPIREAITVNYGSFPSNTESDLIAITFPDKQEYTTVNKFEIKVRDSNGQEVPTRSKRGDFNYKTVVNSLIERDFTDCEVTIIQCKTNWNDNAQIPMLWDMIYSSKGFNNSVTVGSTSYSIRDIRKFSYAFVTVPTVDKNKISSNSVCVKRVQNITGGNYWGYPSVSSVASSLKEIFRKNFSNACVGSLLENINNELVNFKRDYYYFQIF